MAANSQPASAVSIVKAPVGAGTTIDSPFSQYISIGAFSDSMRTPSIFYRLLGDNALVRSPFYIRVGMVATPVSAAVVGEGHSVPVSKVTLANGLLTPLKVARTIVCTQELLSNLGADGQALFNRELGGAIADAVDAAFLNLIVHTGITSNPSAGVTAVNAHHDLRTALLAVSTVGRARLYWVCSPDVASKASSLATTTGSNAFPEMTPTGGLLEGLTAVVGSGVPAGTAYLIDASGIAANGVTPSVDVSFEADIAMSDAPSMDPSVPTAAQMTSMFQTNSVALQATAWIGAETLRNNAVAVITGIN